MDFIKTILEHADVLSAGIAGLLIFGLTVVFGAYKIITRFAGNSAADRLTADKIAAALAESTAETLASTIKEFSLATERQSVALTLLGREIAESRRECAEKHATTQLLLTKLIKEADHV